MRPLCYEARPCLSLSLSLPLSPSPSPSPSPSLSLSLTHTHTHTHVLLEHTPHVYVGRILSEHKSIALLQAAASLKKSLCVGSELGMQSLILALNLPAN
jgi:hypothetical protein